MFKHRIEEDPDSGADLPDLNCADVAAATVKIQKVYRGFATRKRMRKVNFHSYFSFSFSFLLYFLGLFKVRSLKDLQVFLENRR